MKKQEKTDAPADLPAGAPLEALTDLIPEPAAEWPDVLRVQPVVDLPSLRVGSRCGAVYSRAKTGTSDPTRAPDSS